MGQKVNQKTILPHRRFHWSTRSLSDCQQPFRLHGWVQSHNKDWLL